MKIDLNTVISALRNICNDTGWTNEYKILLRLGVSAKQVRRLKQTGVLKVDRRVASRLKLEAAVPREHPYRNALLRAHEAKYGKG